MGQLFGTDGIRGVANQYPMTAEMALRIGKATAYFFRREGYDSRIIVGKDTRISGYMIESAIISGICSMGVNIIQVYPQMLINIEVNKKPDISTIPEIMQVISSVENALGEKGRVLVRYSRTQSMCRVMVERPTHEDTERYCKIIADVVCRSLN